MRQSQEPSNFETRANPYTPRFRCGPCEFFSLIPSLDVKLVGLTIPQDGDLLGTKKLSIGCDATSRTAGPLGAALGDELGLDGHNHFESDTSLTRNDYFLDNGDNYSWNATVRPHPHRR